MKLRLFGLLAAISLLLSGFVKPIQKTEIYDLRCENRINPLGIGTDAPRFSWKIRSAKNGTCQTAWQVLVASDSLLLSEKKADYWNSGKVSSAASVLVPYHGKQPGSVSVLYWKIRVWDEKGRQSTWSAVARFSTGLLKQQDWKAAWIGLPDPDAKKDLTNSPLLRAKFHHQNNGQNLLLYVNSLGYHEVWLNGQKVGQDVLSPAVSQFNKRSQVIAYDLSRLAKSGENDLILWIGRGWYSEGLPGVVNKGPLVRAQLEESGKLGRKIILASSSTWKARMSTWYSTGTWQPGQFGGEKMDGSKMIADWSTGGLDKLEWMTVTEVNVPDHQATAQMVEPNRIQETIPAKSVVPIPEDSWLVDMGKSLTGWLEVKFPLLQKGQEVKMEYCDHLDKDGKFVDRKQIDSYIASGTGNEAFINKFNYHGFRYVRISGLKEKPANESVTAYLIHTDYSAGSHFECSDNDMNRIHNMIHYTLRCLSLGGYLVDCPQLERLGYGGDGNASTEAAQLMFGLGPLYTNWLQAWGDCIRDDGGMPHTAPNPYKAGGGPYWCGFIITASWKTFLSYNDTLILRKYYPAMKQWLGYVEKYSPDGLLQRWPDTDYRNWYLGDWAAPEGIDIKSQKSVDLINNSFVCLCYDYMQKIAGVLGKTEDIPGFAAKSAALKEQVHQTYFDPVKNTYGDGTQIDLAFPMLAGVVPGPLFAKVKESLFTETEKRGGHIACGLVGIPVLTEWALKNDATDYFYSMLKKKEYPGYLYMLENGATTTWEEWENPRSYIHNCFNGIGNWFYEAIGGIRMDKDYPGWQKVIIDPRIPQGITWAKTTKETPYGPVVSAWKIENGTFSLSLEIPVGITAKVIIPENIQNYNLNGKACRVLSGMNFFETGSGKYNLVYSF